MSKFLIIYEKTENNYSAYSPELPGCIATGKTKEETQENMREAIIFHLKGMEEDGITIPADNIISEYIEI